MKILVVHNRYRSSSPSGEDRVVDQEQAGLVEAGHEVRSFERHSDDIAGFSLAQKALVPARVVWSRGPGRELAELIGEYRPDIVHVHNLFPLLSPSILQACARAGVPCVVTFHNFRLICAGAGLFRDGSICRDCVGRLLPIPAVVHGCYRDSSLATLPRAASVLAHRKIFQQVPSAYVFLSEAQRREFESVELPLSRSFVKPNLVPPVKQRGGTDGLIAFLGRLTEEKGLRVLMRAWDRYVTAHPEPGLRLAVAGAGPLDTEVAAWAQSHSSVEYLGLLDRAGCEDLAARATAMVVPSEWPEPFGLVVVEAMAAGVPPIATNHGAFPELIRHGHDGVLYPPGDHTSLTGIFARIDADPAWAEALGKAAHETYAVRFSPERNIAELERIYRFAIDHPRSTTPAV